MIKSIDYDYYDYDYTLGNCSPLYNFFLNLDSFYNYSSEYQDIFDNEMNLNSLMDKNYNFLKENKQKDNWAFNYFNSDFIDNMQTTKMKTLNTNNFLSVEPKLLNIEEDDKDNNNVKDGSNYKSFTFQEIKDCFQKKGGDFTEISKKFLKTPNIENAENKLLCNNKRKREISNENKEFCQLKINKEETKQKKRGRKIIGQKKSKVYHDKYSEDNIIKKIKCKLFSYSLLFLNNVLKSINKEDSNILYNLNHEIIKQIKKDLDLKILNTSLKDLFSSEINPKNKNKNISSGYNKIIINKIVGTKIETKKYQTLMFAFNLSFGKWLELFTYKTSLEELIKGYVGVDNEIIKNSFVGVEKLLKNMLDKNKNDDEFFSLFTFFLYNYERWFFIKRNRSNKNHYFN